MVNNDIIDEVSTIIKSTTFPFKCNDLSIPNIILWLIVFWMIAKFGKKCKMKKSKDVNFFLRQKRMNPRWEEISSNEFAIKHHNYSSLDGQGNLSLKKNKNIRPTYGTSKTSLPFQMIEYYLFKLSHLIFSKTEWEKGGKSPFIATFDAILFKFLLKMRNFEVSPRFFALSCSTCHFVVLWFFCNIFSLHSSQTCEKNIATYVYFALWTNKMKEQILILNL